MGREKGFRFSWANAQGRAHGKAPGEEYWERKASYCQIGNEIIRVEKIYIYN